MKDDAKDRSNGKTGLKGSVGPSCCAQNKVCLDFGCSSFSARKFLSIK